MSQLSVIGCGLMGSALIRTLAKAGIELTIWNRTQEKAQALRQPGVSVAESVAAAVAASPVAIIVLLDLDYSLSMGLLEPEKANLAHKTIIQLSSGASSDASSLSAFVGAASGSYIDGAILVDPQTIGTPKSRILYSGDAPAFEAVKPTLDILGEAIFVGAPPGAAGTLEMALNVAAIPMEVGLLQGRKICELEQCPLDVYDTLVKDFITDQRDRILENATHLDPTHLETVETSVGLLAEATHSLSEYLKMLNIDAGMFEALARLYAGGVASGRAEHDVLCVAELHAISEDAS